MISPKDLTPAYVKKDFPSALNVFLTENCPQLGGDLMITPVIEAIMKMVDEYYPKSERFRQGQFLWYAIDELETSGYGKKIEKCKTKPVVLNLFDKEDIDDLMNKVPKKERMKKISIRIFKQAYEQKGVLTNEDLGGILKLSSGTISRYIREHENEHNEIIPRRGSIHDMGPTLTHKKIICYKYFREGKSIEDVCRETRHSPDAVSRYIDAFARVRECLKENWGVDRISQVTDISRSLTQVYMDLINSKEITFEKRELPR